MSAVVERAAADATSASKMPNAEKMFDREANDVGNILGLDHINLVVAEQQLATAFYIMGLGFTRDPYLRVGLSSMTVNVGRSQFHISTAGAGDLPSGALKPSAQKLRGTIGLVVSDLEELVKRLDKITPLLKGTEFGYKVQADHVAVRDAEAESRPHGVSRCIGHSAGETCDGRPACARGACRSNCPHARRRESCRRDSRVDTPRSPGRTYRATPFP